MKVGTSVLRPQPIRNTNVSEMKDALARMREELTALNKAVTEQGIRLTLAQAWIDLYKYGYDMFRAYGVDFKLLREYNEDSTLDEAAELPLSQARLKIVQYIGRVRSGINAAVRRKQFRLH